MINVSVIVPTYNRRDQLQRVLAGLEKQTYPLDCFEVVVISDGSSDGTNDYLQTVAQFPAATPLRLCSLIQENQGVAAARNRGIQHAQGQIVLFVDDDVVPEPQLIAEHMRLHQELGDKVIVLGPMLTPPQFNMFPWVLWEQAMLEKQYQAMLEGRWEPTARQFYTGNTSLARGHLLDVGGFDPNFRRAEDVELAYRLVDRGLRFVFNYQAVGYHYAERSFNSWINIPYAYGRNDVIFTYQKGQSWLLPTVWHEYHGRHPLIRTLAQACLDRPQLSHLAIMTMKQCAWLAHQAHLKHISAVAYSGIFNLRHYQGITDELGGRELFFAGAAGQGVEPQAVPCSR